MTSLFLTLRQDPTALVECLAAAITALYLLRLSFHDELTACERESAKLSFPAARRSQRDISLAEKFLRFFAVGETIVISKRSLRKQRCRG